jgi:hypothetical protein
MRAMLKICLQSPKHKCKYALLAITLMLSSFKFKTLSKCVLVHFQLSLPLCLLCWLAYDAPASYSLGLKIHELLFMSSYTVCPCPWIFASLSQLASSIGCPFHLTKYSKYVFLRVFFLILWSIIFSICGFLATGICLTH